MPRESREKAHGRYVEYFLRRNGYPNFANRTLPLRELWMRGIQEQRAILQERLQNAVTQQEFDTLYYSRVDLAEAKPLTRLLVWIARANQREAWGVDRTLDRALLKPPTYALHASPRVLADLEELYHTRMLREIVGAYSLAYEFSSPPLPLQAFIRLIAAAPSHLARPLLAAGEVFGTIAFARMLDEARLVLHDDPPAAHFAERIIIEILIDEISHVSVLASMMCTAERKAVRLLLPTVGHMIGGREYGVAVRPYSLDSFPSEVLAETFMPLGPEVF